MGLIFIPGTLLLDLPISTADGNLAAFFARPLGHGDRQDPPFELRFDLLRVDARRKLERSMEGPIRPFHAKELLFADLFLETSLTPERDAILIDAELDVALLDFRELRFEDETLVGFVEVDRWRPGS
jgi:hypothetical protein